MVFGLNLGTRTEWAFATRQLCLVRGNRSLNAGEGSECAHDASRIDSALRAGLIGPLRMSHPVCRSSFLLFRLNAPLIHFLESLEYVGEGLQHVEESIEHHSVMNSDMEARHILLKGIPAFREAGHKEHDR